MEKLGESWFLRLRVPRLLSWGTQTPTTAASSEAAEDAAAPPELAEGTIVPFEVANSMEPPRFRKWKKRNASSASHCPVVPKKPKPPALPITTTKVITEPPTLAATAPEVASEAALPKLYVLLASSKLPALPALPRPYDKTSDMTDPGLFPRLHHGTLLGL